MTGTAKSSIRDCSFRLRRKSHLSNVVLEEQNLMRTNRHLKERKTFQTDHRQRR